MERKFRLGIIISFVRKTWWLMVALLCVGLIVGVIYGTFASTRPIYNTVTGQVHVVILNDTWLSEDESNMSTAYILRDKWISNRDVRIKEMLFPASYQDEIRAQVREGLGESGESMTDDKLDEYYTLDTVNYTLTVKLVSLEKAETIVKNFQDRIYNAFEGRYDEETRAYVGYSDDDNNYVAVGSVAQFIGENNAESRDRGIGYTTKIEENEKFELRRNLESPVSWYMAGIIGVLVAGVIYCAIIFLIFYFNGKLLSADEFSDNFDVPVIEEDSLNRGYIDAAIKIKASLGIAPAVIAVNGDLDGARLAEAFSSLGDKVLLADIDAAAAGADAEISESDKGYDVASGHGQLHNLEQSLAELKVKFDGVYDQIIVSASADSVRKDFVLIASYADNTVIKLDPRPSYKSTKKLFTDLAVLDTVNLNGVIF